MGWILDNDKKNGLWFLVSNGIMGNWLTNMDLMDYKNKSGLKLDFGFQDLDLKWNMD